MPNYRKTKDGGFNGVANRFCTDKKPSPVKEMPIFTVGEERPNRPDDTFSFTPKKEKTVVAAKPTEEKLNNSAFLSDPKPIETTDNSENIEKMLWVNSMYLLYRKKLKKRCNNPDNRYCNCTYYDRWFLCLFCIDR